MVSQAVVGPGFLLDYFDSVTADWIHVGEVRDIDGPGDTTDEFEVTNQDSTGGYKEFVPTLQDGGTLTADMNLIPGDAGQAALTDLKHDRTITDWRVRVPSDPVTAVYFEGFLNDLSYAFPLNGAATRSLGIRVTGPVSDPTGYLGS